MRRIDCPAVDCGHLHAASDEQLMQSVVRHVHEAHPEMSFRSHDAELLVHSGAYDDTEHTARKKQSLADLADVAGRASTGY